MVAHLEQGLCSGISTQEFAGTVQHKHLIARALQDPTELSTLTANTGWQDANHDESECGGVALNLMDNDGVDEPGAIQHKVLQPSNFMSHLNKSRAGEEYPPLPSIPEHSYDITSLTNAACNLAICDDVQAPMSGLSDGGVKLPAQKGNSESIIKQATNSGVIFKKCISPADLVGKSASASMFGKTNEPDLRGFERSKSPSPSMAKSLMPSKLVLNEGNGAVFWGTKSSRTNTADFVHIHRSITSKEGPAISSEGVKNASNLETGAVTTLSLGSKQTTPTDNCQGQITGKDKKVVNVDGGNLMQSRFWDPLSKNFKPDMFWNPILEAYICPFPSCEGLVFGKVDSI
jgi:hypothetical protein